MLPLRGKKIIQRATPTTEPTTDTPITTLSKILSKASFGEHANPSERKLSESSLSQSIPADIDESANQEPPTQSFPIWTEPSEICISSHSQIRPTLHRDVSSSYSSGYFSSSTTQSAPPTCHSERIFDFGSSRSELSGHPLTCIGYGQQNITHTANFSPSKFSSNLRRAHSCLTRGWLAKRTRRQVWPRISGILRGGRGSLSPSAQDTNSCPADIVPPVGSVGQPCRLFALPSGMCPSSSTYSPPTKRANMFNKYPLSPIRATDTNLSLTDVSSIPQPKKQRLDSSLQVEPPCGCRTPPKMELDSTLPLADISVDDLGDLPSRAAEEKRQKPSFDVLRHHSTPMLLARANALELSPTIPPPAVSVVEDKHHLSRCATVPVSDKFTNLSACNSEAKCNRALPIVDRTTSGLHCVSMDTVARLVSGTLKKENLNYIIVDCRYPYEYEGGHIQGAINIFTHSDMVQEIFNRVPAQRPPGCQGSPRLLGECLTRRLSKTKKEPLSAPCEPISDDDTDEEVGCADDDDDSDIDQLPCESSETDSIVDPANVSNELDSSTDSVDRKPEPNVNSDGSENSSASASTPTSPTFAVIFHCEFSSQRAPDLATFLRNIDRQVNYHRYPFLYFPEIYIMKGGYSAFYRKYANLCSPGEYIKMFHKDYRSHLRLYKRLTKRVSSACLACIRPQHKLLGSLDLATTADAMNSFIQSSSNQIPLIPPMPFNPLSPNSALADSVIQRPASQDSTNPLLETSDNKENKVAHTDETDNRDQSGIVLDLPPSAAGRSTDSSESPATHRSVHDDSPSDEASSPDDSSLSLPEEVVRAGRRVIASTLSDSDPSIGLAKVLDRLGHRDPAQSSDNARGLKRANTVMGVCNTGTSGRKKRLPLRNLFNQSISCSFNDESCATPSLGRKRASTLEHSSFDSMHQRRSGDQSPAVASPPAESGGVKKQSLPSSPPLDTSHSD